VLRSSIGDNTGVGRNKNFSREHVLRKALPIFWKYGFAHTSLGELEKATGVNKSGLYAEFADKSDLYVESLRYYLKQRHEEGLLTAKPLGWKNIERFLIQGPCSLEGRPGCFSINSWNQFALLPPQAKQAAEASRAFLKDLIERNLEAEKTKLKPAILADMILTFFTGIAMEQHLKVTKASRRRKVAGFMRVLRKL